MSFWKLIILEAPPVDHEFWGYDEFYGGVHTCTWDGENLNDDGCPFPVCVDQAGDDHNITFWGEKEKIPDPPNVQMYPEFFEPKTDKS